MATIRRNQRRKVLLDTYQGKYIPHGRQKEFNCKILSAPRTKNSSEAPRGFKIVKILVEGETEPRLVSVARIVKND